MSARDEVRADLLRRGWPSEDVRDYLDEVGPVPYEDYLESQAKRNVGRAISRVAIAVSAAAALVAWAYGLATLWLTWGCH